MSAPEKSVTATELAAIWKSAIEFVDVIDTDGSYSDRRAQYLGVIEVAIAIRLGIALPSSEPK